MRDDFLVRVLVDAQELQCDEPIKPFIISPIDHTHAAASHDLLQLEVVNAPRDKGFRAAGRAGNERERLLFGDVDLPATGRAGLE